MPEIDDAIATNAQGPKEATVDGTAVKQHSLPDQIAASKHAATVAAAAGSKIPIKFFKISPGGTTT